jgi:RimJ/RimL family protein N-acetyltransferase
VQNTSVSFGPRMRGQMVLWWDDVMRPFDPQPNNFKDLWDPGHNRVSSFAISNATERARYRLGYTRSDFAGVFPGYSQDANRLTLTGDLVVLRPVSVSDAQALAASVLDPDVSRLTGTHTWHSLEELERWYASRAEHDDRLDLAIVERATGETVGEVVLNNLNIHNRSCGFRITLFSRRFFGRGLGTEASRMVLAHAFETIGLHRIALEVYAFNPRARHVYEKIGFVHEGTQRHALRWQGDWIDADTMALLAPEWAEHRGHPPTSL